LFYSREYWLTLDARRLLWPAEAAYRPAPGGLLRRLLGVKSDDKKQTKVQKLAKNEVLMINMHVDQPVYVSMLKAER